ncbi:PTS fructose transporter subunit IIA [Vagococcus sp. PNs007]|uniref:PTS fructose transporter subunit IIA n=1 Tax=Vagococcus proximus TaxID=2991417 RepID=A0ABT5X266_9ENTE|nr:PTS fructose transporter subunit IIA [Vagococcus proximus]MDF0480085.1 PTS fructose transporter subunit IIA [Vagococcus proximus]
MFNICVVGHGNYPDGMVSALKLLSGTDENITKFNLNQDLTHADYETQLNEYLDNNDEVIVFADMTGGAPHQIASRLIMEKGKRTQYIISSAPLNLLLEIVMKINLQVLNKDNVEAELQRSLVEAKEVMLLLPETETFEEVEEEEEEGI